MNYFDKRSLPTSEIRGSNPVRIYKFFNCIDLDLDKEKHHRLLCLSSEMAIHGLVVFSGCSNEADDLNELPLFVGHLRRHLRRQLQRTNFSLSLSLARLSWCERKLTFAAGKCFF